MVDPEAPESYRHLAAAAGTWARVGVSAFFPQRLFRARTTPNYATHEAGSHSKHVGWSPYRVASYVNWCGHGQEVIPVPRADGLVAFVPALGEAS